MGEEIGMTDPSFDSIDDYKDIESHNAYKLLKDRGLSDHEALNIIVKKSRDNSRTPMQWDDSKNAGFSEGSPWINLANNFEDINVEKALDDKNSIYHYYKKLINLRKSEDIISDGLYYPILEDNPNILAYVREYEGEVLLNINNFFSKEIEIKLDNVIEDFDKFDYLLGNYGPVEIKETILLRPYESLSLIKR